MIKLVVVYLLVPILAILWLILSKSQCKFNWISKVFGISSYIVYLFIWGEWSIYSYILRYLLVILLVTGIIKSYIDIRGERFFTETKYSRWFLSRVSIFIGILFIYQTYLFWDIGSYSKVEAINLAFPFNDGIYSVSKTGINDRGNLFIDIVKLNKALTHTNILNYNELKDYEIYDDIVYSPCDGVVISTKSQLKDYFKNSSSFTNYNGNYIIVHSNNGYFVVIENLRRNSIIVEDGEAIEVGQPIARIGNSAKSNYPHLHIYATTELYSDSKRLRIKFEGKKVYKNKLFVKK